jgi:hypothetical protein
MTDAAPLADKTTSARGFLYLYSPDRLTERLCGMGREAAVSFSVEKEGDKLTTIWLENTITGHREDVPIEDADPFVLMLLDMVIQVGEDSGRPWRARREAS